MLRFYSANANNSCAAKFNNRFKTKPLQLNCNHCGILLTRTRNSRYNKYCADCISNGKHCIKIKDPLFAKQPASIRKYLLDHRERKCEKCKLEKWNDEPIPLEVDHIDGDSTNNSELNLRLLCCNCHAQTPTFRSKNKGNGRAFRRQRYKDGKSY